jgi:hypothetical protein
MHATGKVTFFLYIFLIMDEILAVVIISRDTHCDGKKTDNMHCTGSSL